jgi:VanZ family protein
LLPAERVHLLEYALVGWLAWRALAQHVGRAWTAWLLALALAVGLGWIEELLQAATPGRFYDPRDVAQNALGAGIGLLVAAALDPRLLAGRAPRHEAAQ